MQISNIPVKVQLPWATNASPSLITAIPVLSQIGVNAGRASFNDGFVPLNFTPVSSGGVPPFGADFNGIFNQLSAWTRWQNAGGPISYDATFQTAVGGYPLGAIVQSAEVVGNYWMSVVENNLTDPDAGGAGWTVPPSMMGTGHWQWRPVADAISGWIISNGTTIGSAASAANQLASASARPAFIYLWSKFSNTICPVSGGRGASAAADWAANKTIGTPDMRSTGWSGVDGMGNPGGGNNLYAGVPVVSGGATTPTSIIGANLHTLLSSESATHFHTAGIADSGHAHAYDKTNLSPNGATGGGGNNSVSLGTPYVSSSTTTVVTGVRVNSSNGLDTTNNSGGGGAHNNTSRVMLGYFFIKM